MLHDKAKQHETAAAASLLLELGFEISCGGVRMYCAPGGGYAVRGQPLLPPTPLYVERNYDTATKAVDAFLAACMQLPYES